MKKYKVEMIQKDTYEIDVLAKDEKDAKARALKKWNKIYSEGHLHYYQFNDTELETGTVYDITNTDDPFNP